MKLSDQKKFAAALRMEYPALREPGMYEPARFGRSVINFDELINIFYDPSSPQYVTEVALYLAGARLKEKIGDPKYREIDPSVIINQHMDLAETYLLHHSKRIEKIYDVNIEEFEVTRGDYLKQVATMPNATPTSCTAYGYWLVGRADKVEATDAAASHALNKEAETYFRKAHYAGHAEATDALATLIYTSSEDVGSAVFYWEKAAKAGNATAVQNLYNVVMGDDRLVATEFISGIKAIWEGVAANKKETKDVVAALNKAGFETPKKPKQGAKERALEAV